jgi:predicted ferric reductase
MKNIKGILLIATTTIVTFLFWYFAVTAQELEPLEKARHIVAGLALNGFFLNFLLATRNKTLEKWFNGLDKLYIYHKYVAISTIGLLFVHAALGDSLKTTEAINLRLVLGGMALFFMVVLVGITLFDKKLTYEKWRSTHKFLIIPYMIGLGHTYISSKVPLLTFSGLSVWVGITALIGILSAIYTLFFFQKTHFKNKGTVTKITKLSPNIIEWEITLEQFIEFSKGQFIFIKVLQEGIENGPHPFSISGGSGNVICLTTKVSGDFTKQIYDSLALSTKVIIEGPYGLMDFSSGKKNQLWIAGGIGITPFIAYLREDHPEQKITLYYSFNGSEAGVYQDLLNDYQKKNKLFRVHFIDTSSMPRLDFEGYALEKDTSIFMCGPEKMIKGYIQYFKSNFKDTDITYEAFKLR